EYTLRLAIGETNPNFELCSWRYILLRDSFIEAENEVFGLVCEDSCGICLNRSFDGVFHDQDGLLYENSSIPEPHYDKVTVLESEKRAWENSPEAQAMRDALNPWRNHDKQTENSP
ncbi:hypothetical protein LINPERPRIM_LOCUS42097, partial [Linum perenne]